MGGRGETFTERERKPRSVNIRPHLEHTAKNHIKIRYIVYIKMPNAKRRNTRKRKRKQRRRRTRMPMPLGGFPNSKIVKLRYVQQSTLDAATGGYSKQTFLANGLNYIYQSANPQRTDPANFLRNMDSYETYCVLGSKCKATCITDGTSNLQPRS